MRRVALLFAVAGAVLVLTGSAALAANRGGGVGDDILGGTDGRDALYGGTGEDWLFGYGGRDLLVAGGGDDFISDGNDRKMDYINCGPGTDVVRADYIDVLRHCEYVTRR